MTSHPAPSPGPYPPAQWPAPTPPPPVRRGALILTGIAVALALVVVACLLISRTTSDNRSGPAPFTGTGQIVVTTIDGYDTGDTGDQCADQSSGYDDISGGVEVVVTDAKGERVATGMLDAGTDDGTGCAYPFTVTDIPAGSSTYGVTISHRGTIRYTQAELTDGVTLTLGDD